MSLKKKMLKQLSCYFEGKVCSSEKLDDSIRIRLTPEQGLLKLSPDFLELKIPVDCGSTAALRTVAWILKSLIEAGHGSEFIMNFTANDADILSLRWYNLSDRAWPWFVKCKMISFSDVSDIFGPPKEEAQSGYRFGPGTVRGDLAEDFEVVRHALERHYKRFWYEMPEGDDSSNSMPIGKQRELLNGLLEAKRYVEAAVKELRG
jgi:hypothetical protein